MGDREGKGRWAMGDREGMGQVIQFPHPGSEPSAPAGCVSWDCALNRGPHKRKFLVTRGEYAVCGDGGAVEEVQNGRLGFWGEWEQPSRAYRYVDEAGPGEPQAWHVPLLEERNKVSPVYPAKCAGPRTFCFDKTGVSIDPFVFTPGFYYACCRISNSPRLANLEPGDLVVFGSHVQGVNVFDTVFVVGERIALEEAWKRSPLFKKTVAITALRAGKRPEAYAGVPARKSVQGMFSFFPALPAVDGGSAPRFARPALPDALITNDGFSAANLRNFKVVHRPAAEEVWQELADATIDSGLRLGVGASLEAGPYPFPPDGYSRQHPCT